MLDFGLTAWICCVCYSMASRMVAIRHQQVAIRHQRILEDLDTQQVYRPTTVIITT